MSDHRLKKKTEPVKMMNVYEDTAAFCTALSCFAEKIKAALHM